MKIKQIDVITIGMGADFTQHSEKTASVESRQAQAISFRFEIEGDEIELLRIKDEAITEMGRAIAKALLAFVQAEEVVRDEKESDRNLQ